MTKYSIVLEGGGARGAYQLGAIKALKECGYDFNCIIGTSIGALNAAFIAQGDIQKLEELWSTLSFEDLIDVNNQIANDALSMKISPELLSELYKKIKKALKDKGIDTSLIKGILEKYIDEEKIRKSKIRFGLVTLCITDMKPQKLYIEDIPQGDVVNYLMATSNLPIFKRQKISDKSFLDGGAFDNCSVEMLYDEGYKDIIAIRLFTKRNRIRNYSKLIKKEDLNLIEIIPSEELPFILNFDTKVLNALVEYGYVDTIKQLKGYHGKKYCIKDVTKARIESFNKMFTTKFSTELSKYANTPLKIGENIKDIAKNNTMKALTKYITRKNIEEFDEQILTILEYVAQIEEVSKLNIYSLNEFIKETKKAVSKSDKKLTGMKKAIYYFVQNIPEEE